MNLVTLFALCATCGVLVAGIYRLLCRLPEYSATDVLPFLHSIDLETLYGTFHPEAEDAFRQKLSPREFREVQWKRFHLGIHYCSMILDNCRVLQGWTRYERRNSWSYLGEKQQDMLRELRTTCVQCRLSSAVIRLRLRWWLVRMRLFPWVAPPSFAALLKVGSADMIAFYDKIREAAELFSAAYGENYHERLMEVL